MVLRRAVSGKLKASKSIENYAPGILEGIGGLSRGLCDDGRAHLNPGQPAPTESCTSIGKFGGHSHKVPGNTSHQSSRFGLMGFGGRGYALEAPLVTSLPSIKRWDDVQREIREWRREGATENSVRSVFQAFHRLGPMPMFINGHDLTAHFSQQLHNLSAVDIVMMYFWVCKSKINDPGFLEEAAKQILAKGVSGLENKHLVLMIYGTALVKGRKTGGADSKPAFPSQSRMLDSLVKELVSSERLGSLTEQDLTNSVYALGWLGFQKTETIEPLLERMGSEGALGKYLEQELVNALHGMSLLNLQDHKSVSIMVEQALSKERHKKYKDQEISNLLHSLGILGCSEGQKENLTLLVQESVRSERLAGYKDQHISNIIGAVGQLGVSDFEVVRILVEEIVSGRRREKLREHHLAAVVYALGKSGFYEDALIGNLLEEVGRGSRLRSYSAKDLAAIICGLGQMDAKEGPLLERMTRELGRPLRLKEISDKQIFSVLMSLSNLDFRDAELVGPLLERSLQSANNATSLDLNMVSQFALCVGKMGVGIRGEAENLLKRALSKPLDSLSSEGLVTLIHGLGDIGASARELLAPVIEEFVKPGRLQSFTPHDISIGMYALGQIRDCDQRIIDKLIWEFTRKGFLEKAGNEALSNVIYGLGQLRHVPSEGVVVLLEGEISKPDRVEKYTFQELANILHSLGLLRLEKRERVAEITDMLAKLAVSPPKLSQSRDMELACMLYGLCHLRYKNPDVLGPLMSTLSEENRLGGLSNKDICNIIYAVGQMGYDRPDHIAPLVKEAGALDRMAQFSPVQVSTLIYSLGKLRYDNDPKAVGVFANELMKSGQMSALKSQDIVNVLHGLVYTRMTGSSSMPRVLTEIGRMERRTEYLGTEVLTISKCLCFLRRRAPSRQVETLLETFIYEMCRSQRLKEYDHRQLAQICITLADAKNRDAGLVLQVLKEMVKPSAGKELSVSDLAKTVWSVGPTGQVNKEQRPFIVVCIRALIYMVLQREKDFSTMPSFHLAEMIIGMGCMGLRDYKILDAMAQELMKPERLESYRPWHLAKIMRALGQLRTHNVKLLKALSREICKPEVTEMFDGEEMSELMSGIIMLESFRDEGLLKVVAKQIRVGNREPRLVKMIGVTTARK
ncbi:hypothetical protein BSKO_11835 [Bryopsis sp. KO-2023]|nr:hypothetical protein BSKO_11835 [Bryopsis sp. KO-2023]